eukprot:1124335-Amphidinium_carterae.1
MPRILTEPGSFLCRVLLSGGLALKSAEVSQNALLAGASALLVGGVAYRYGVGSQPSPGPK